MKVTNIDDEEIDQLWLWLNQASYLMIKVRDQEVKRLGGIGMMRVAVLDILKKSKVPVTPGELSRWIFREPHTASSLINRMEKDGLVRKTKGSERRNLVIVEITEKGEKIYQEMGGKKSVKDIFVTTLTETERKNLARICEKLRDRALVELGMSLYVPYPPRGGESGGYAATTDRSTS